MQKIRIVLGVLTTLAALSACSNPPANPGTDSGVMPTDTGTGGVDSATDAGHSTIDSATDGGGSSGGTCAMPINLNTAGTALATGTGRTIATSNTGAPVAAMSTVATACADDGMGGSLAVSEVVFQYTVQTGGHIQASTDDPATTAALDSIVWILDGCASTAMELACNDDAGSALLSTAITDASIPAGTTVFIVVAGYGGADTTTGAITLNVTEVQPHAAGDVCDATNFYCVTGFTCVRDAAGADTGHCLGDGAEYGICRTTGTACDGSLMCSVATPTDTDNGTCQMPIAGAGACAPGHHDLCVAMFSCRLDDASMTDGHCIADGAEYGACRLTAPFCDGTFTCSVAAPTATTNGTCQVPLADGAVCTMRHDLCVMPDECVPDATGGMGHCIADGAMGGYCRDTDPACDGTLTCDPDAFICG